MIARHINPILNVRDVSAAIAWFERLGWRTCWEHRDDGPGGRVTFGAVGSGDCELFLCEDDQGGRGDLRVDGQGTGSWMSIWVDDVDAVHAHCLAVGIAVAMPPTDEPWGAREMHLETPDGHVLRISTAPAA